MGLIIGMDEAGYGPNLGPLVIATTVWEVPGHPRDCDLWSAFETVVTNQPERNDPRLHIADSKDVYTPARGIARLEKSVLTALAVNGVGTTSFVELVSLLMSRNDTGFFSSTDAHPEENVSQSWLEAGDLSLPTNDKGTINQETFLRWQECCDNAGVRLMAVAADIVSPRRFNRLVRAADSKGIALSQLSLSLLRRMWNPDAAQSTQVFCDKHGGRNRYDTFLADILDGQMIFRGEETMERSVYRIGETEIRFQMKAEQHLPVALASMVAKYIRELSMDLFNQFWREHLPELKPTKGYPQDAKRFREEIAAKQEELEISDEILWRER